MHQQTEPAEIGPALTKAIIKSYIAARKTRNVRALFYAACGLNKLLDGAPNIIAKEIRRVRNRAASLMVRFLREDHDFMMSIDFASLLIMTDENREMHKRVDAALENLEFMRIDIPAGDPDRCAEKLEEVQRFNWEALCHMETMN